MMFHIRARFLLLLKQRYWGCLHLPYPWLHEATLNFSLQHCLRKKWLNGVLRMAFPLIHSLMLMCRIPNGREMRTCTITRQGKSIYDNSVIEKVDPRGGKYYWIGGNEIKFQHVDESDFQAIAHGVISITPLKTDHTNYAFIEDT